MSMNRYMHPRNPYKSPPNFNELSLFYPEFVKYISRKPNGKIIFDFKNPDALRCLTLILLKRDFDLELTIPKNKLIPTLPLRLNYLLWIEDLFNWTEENKFPVSGIDIGTGATCIYALLAAKKNDWRMLATETDPSSVETAIENTKKNSLDHMISVIQVSKSTYLDGVLDENKNYDFCMCNPPFFNNDAEPCRKRRNIDSSDDDYVPSGTADEIQSNGGEVEFVKSIIQDSLKLRDQIKIFTTMIGHKSSLAPLLEELKNNNIKSVSQTEFCQGRTVRWAIAWTLKEEQLKNYSPLSQTKLLKPITWLFKPKFPFKECAELVIPQLLSQLKIECTLLEDFKKRRLWRIFAAEVTWTGLRKKRREKLRNKEESEKAETPSAVSCESEGSAVLLISEDSQIKTECAPKCVSETETTHFNIKPKLRESGPKTDYCTLYVANEKRKKSVEEIEIPLKKQKLDDIDSSLINSCKSCVLQALLSAKSMPSKIELQILYESGKKDAPQQILQFLKNNLSE